MYEVKDQFDNTISLANIITFQEWQTLKQYGNITEGTRGFIPEELDEAVVFFDADLNYIDYLERKKVENIHPAFILLPRFFWEHHKVTLPVDFIPGMKIEERLAILQKFKREVKFRREAMFLSDKYYFQCDMVPRPEQEEPLEFLAKTMKEKNSLRGILQAAPGAGKTAMSIKTIHGARVRSVIVVPNTVLQDQWIEAIVEFTDLKEEDIAVIQGSDLKKIKEEIGEKPIAIIKIQSLFSQIKNNKFPEVQDVYKYIDMVIYDECHNSGAATSYAKTSSLFLTSNVLGLSATPYRQGLNDYLLRTSIGETIFKLEHSNLTPDIEIHNVWTEFTEAEHKRLIRSVGDYIIFLGVFNSMIKNKDIYFQYLADVVNYNLSQNHNIVVLFPTIFMICFLFR
jgi:hypothetical protein